MLALLTAAACLIFAQAYMIAPILVRLGQAFHTSSGVVGLAVPAYLVPYGVMTLVWGPLSDRVGRRSVIVASLSAFVALTALSALSTSAAMFIAMRLATALGASGVVPISLALIGDLFPYERRGRALGWLFGGMAGGIAAGAAGGALAEPLAGWPGLFLAVGAAGLVLLALVAATGVLRASPRPTGVPALRAVIAGYASLLRVARGRRTYAYVLVTRWCSRGSTPGSGSTSTAASASAPPASASPSSATASPGSSSGRSSDAWPTATAGPGSSQPGSR